MILYSLIGDMSEPRYRKLTYAFSSLKGIIFGIRTPETDKLKIIETIHKKCRQKTGLISSFSKRTTAMRSVVSRNMGST